ncbi:hypothetical protein GCM10007301_04330 [Azorhizobium oxalatiphilum]|uniref:Uncharacterized protein n=1 Tax=Azorhizobium oxalatiphilum TaxID=980631 RepID=A0A917BLI6_9HYPH|nr:hypothetical protein [Azorhizobium oxalatiphilum]GGF48170.1 hypothetical protein GCM10007301_04330 [Azorhizobium oxalatiphilum]
MIRFLFRFLGFWLMAGAFVALVVDGTRSIAATDIVFTSAARTWFSLSPGTLELAQAKVIALSPVAWTAVVNPLLNLPLFFLLGLVGVICLAIGRVPARSPFEAT